MTYGAKLVVRKKGEEVRAGFASEYPIRQGWKHIKDYGTWQGSQMGYRPFLKAVHDAHRLADRLNEAIKK